MLRQPRSELPSAGSLVWVPVSPKRNRGIKGIVRGKKEATFYLAIFHRIQTHIWDQHALYIPHMLGQAVFEDKTQERREEVCFYTQSFVSWISFQMGLLPSLGSSFNSGHSSFQFLGASSMWFYIAVPQSGTCLSWSQKNTFPYPFDVLFESLADN